MRPTKQHTKQYRFKRAVELSTLNSLNNGSGGGLVIPTARPSGMIQYDPSNCTSSLKKRIDEFVKVLVNGVYIEIF